MGGGRRGQIARTGGVEQGDWRRSFSGDDRRRRGGFGSLLHALTPRAASPMQRGVSKLHLGGPRAGARQLKLTLRPKLSEARPHGSAGPQCATKLPPPAAKR